MLSYTERILQLHKGGKLVGGVMTPPDERMEGWFGHSAIIFHANIRKYANFYKMVCIFCICVVYYLRIPIEYRNV